MTPVATCRYRRRDGVAFFFRSFCFLFWFFFVLFKEGSLGESWSELTCGQRDTASGRGKGWVPAMPDRPFAGAIGKEPIRRCFCENPEITWCKSLLFQLFIWKIILHLFNIFGKYNTFLSSQRIIYQKISIFVRGIYMINCMVNKHFHQIRVVK